MDRGVKLPNRRGRCGRKGDEAMATAKPVRERDHEFRIWRRARGITLADAAQRVSALLGRPVSAQYLGIIESKRRRPGWDLACAMSQTTGDVVPAVKIMAHGYRSARRAN